MNDPDTKALTRHLLLTSANAVSETLAAAGIDPEAYAFTLVLWPMGEPTYCSCITASGNQGANAEAPDALKEAQRESREQSPIVFDHRNPGNA